MRIFRRFIAVLSLICLIPVCALLLACMLARWSGCEIDPDLPVAFHIPGSDCRGILYGMADFGWLTVAAVPLLVALGICWVIVEIVQAIGHPAKQDPGVRWGEQDASIGSR
jgi:hypothetical protein